MPATTRSRKRQRLESQDTDQSTAAKETKISKPEDRKVSSSVVADSEDVEQKKCQKGKEKPKGKNILKRLPCEMICRIFRYLPDKDLFNQMLSDRFFEKSAGYVLQRRKMFLSSLDFSCGTELVLTVETSRTLPHDGKSPLQYKLKVDNAAALCEGYEEKKGNNLTRAFHLLMSYYNCSAADINGRAYTDNIPFTLEAFFGPAPSEPSKKTKIRFLEMTSHTAPMLCWLRPTTIDVYGAPNWFIETSQKQLKELITGIDQIVFSNPYMDRIDNMMEACEAKHISIYPESYWSDKSIFSVVQANIDANNNGITRTIKMHCMDDRCNSHHWKVLFKPLMNSYEDTLKDGRVSYRIEMTKCTLQYYGRFDETFGTVNLYLH